MSNEESTMTSSGSSDSLEASIEARPYNISLDPATREGSRRGRSGHKKNGGVWNDNSKSPRPHQLKEGLTVVSINPSHMTCSSPRRRGIFRFSRSKSRGPVKRPVDEEDFFFSEAPQHQNQSHSLQPITANDCEEEVRDLQELVRTRTRDRFKVTLPAETVRKTCLRLVKGNFEVEDEYDDIEFVGAEKLQNGEIQNIQEPAMVYRKQNECRQGGDIGRNNHHREEDQVEFLGFESVYKPLEHQLQLEQDPRLQIERIISVVKSLSPRNKKRAANDLTPNETHDDQTRPVEEFSPAEVDTKKETSQPKFRSVRLRSRRRRRKRKSSRRLKQSYSSDDLKNVLDTKTVGKDSESVASVALLCQWLQCTEIEGVDPMCSKGNPHGMMISTSSASEGTISPSTTFSVEETDEQDSKADTYESNRCFMEDFEG